MSPLRPGAAELIKKRLADSAETKRKMLEDERLVGVIETAAGTIVEAFRAGNQAIVFGNGGSAADAQHIVAELVGKFYLTRAPLPATSLTVNTSSLTALANDFSYDQVFAIQLRGLARRGDVAIGISTSGNSPNVVEAIKAAREIGCSTFAFTGESGGALEGLADHCLRIPSNDTPRIQEGHITAGHVLCELVEAAMFGAG